MCDLDQLNGSFVPKGHNLTNSLTRYLAYREAGGVATRNIFIQWAVQHHGRAEGGASADWYPLGDGQCGFGNLSLPDLVAVTNDPAGYRASQILHAAIPLVIQDACQTVRSAYVVGVYRKREFGNADLLRDLVDRGFAGTENAARVILNVGQSFLRHFELIDDSVDRPNGRYALLFRC